MLISESNLKKLIRNIILENIIGAGGKAGSEYLKSTIGAGVETGAVDSYVGQVQAFSDVIAKYIDVKEVKWAEKEIEFLIRNPRIKAAFDAIAPKIDDIDNLLNSPLAARVLGTTSAVLVVLVAFSALPTAIGMTLDNLSKAEGMLRNHYDKQPDHLRPVSYHNLADTFEPHARIRRQSGAKGRDDVIKILAMDMISKENSKKVTGKYTVQSLLQDGIIDNNFYGRVLTKKRELLDQHVDIEKVKSMASSAEIEHKGIMLGLICNILKASGVGLGPIGGDDIIKGLSSATGVTF